MATSISFTYGATTVSIRPAEFADRREVLRVQARGRTHDGELLVGDHDLTILRFYLSWSNISDDERDEIEEFFGSAKVNGSLNTFVYVDHFGESYYVKLLDDVVAYYNQFTNMWRFDLALEQVDAEAS